MLTKCPECELQVSDKALTCPHCGYPLIKTERTERSKSRPKRHKRLPNGFGQISEIKDHNLRRPFRAMVTIGKNPEGKPICKLLKPQAYFKTYNDAYQALMEYNKNPYDIGENIKFKDLYKLWFDEYKTSGVSESSVKHYQALAKYCSPFNEMPFTKIRPSHIMTIINDEKIAITMRRMVYFMFDKIYDYAIRNGITNVNYCDSIIPPKYTPAKDAHICFTDDEMNLLWAGEGDFWVNVILLNCYSGWRPQEMLNIKLSDVDLKAKTFKGGLKTESGIGRVVPIHSKVFPIVEKLYTLSKRMNGEYLISQKGGPVRYRYYLDCYNKTCKHLELNANHKPHDARVQFVTMAKKAGVDEYAIKKIIGHSVSDITERVYTKRDPEWLRNEIEKII